MNRRSINDFKLDPRDLDRRLLSPETVEALEELEDRSSTVGEKVADAVSDFCGSGIFVWLHILWFTAWITVNSAIHPTFDPPPFGVLTLIVSLEAIFLSTFLLISQRRSEDKDRERAIIDFKLSRVAEEKICDLSDEVRELSLRIDELMKELRR
jgi:uncharacterized membrane protein